MKKNMGAISFLIFFVLAIISSNTPDGVVTGVISVAALLALGVSIFSGIKYIVSMRKMQQDMLAMKQEEIAKWKAKKKK
jgi:hypothetical protein